MSSTTTRFIVELRAAQTLPGQAINPVTTLIALDALSIHTVQKQVESALTSGIADEAVIYSPVITLSATRQVRVQSAGTLLSRHQAEAASLPSDE